MQWCSGAVVQWCSVPRAMVPCAVCVHDNMVPYARWHCAVGKHGAASSLGRTSLPRFDCATAKNSCCRTSAASASAALSMKVPPPSCDAGEAGLRVCAHACGRAGRRVRAGGTGRGVGLPAALYGLPRPSWRACADPNPNPITHPHPNPNQSAPPPSWRAFASRARRSSRASSADRRTPG